MVERRIRVGVVEDQPLFRDLVVSGLSTRSDIEVVFSVATVKSAREAFAQTPVDVALLDVELPDGNGIGLGAGLKRANPALGIVTLSILDMLEPILSLEPELRRGWSYVLKGSASNLEILAQAIVRSAQGENYFDPALARSSVPRPDSSVARLTRRQFEVLQRTALGDSNEAIAQELGIALNSVVNHLTAIYATLGIPDGKNARVSATLAFLAETQRD